jgi:hypothetical protein
VIVAVAAVSCALVVVAPAASGVAPVASPQGRSADRPEVAYWTDAGVEVSTATGRPVAAFPMFDNFSLDGSLLAGALMSFAGGEVDFAITGFALPAGGPLFTIPSGFNPTVLDERGRVAFWATFARDAQVNSLWLRERDGRIRRIVQFANGPGLPGYDPGFGGDNVLLSTSFDRRGRVLAVAQGNDVDLFVYDVFTVDVGSGRVTRHTSDHRSRWPAVSPNGRSVAYQQEVGICGGLDFVRAARLVIARIDASRRRIISGGSCGGWLHNPRWVSNSSLVAYRTATVGASEFRTNLVVVDVRTGRQRLLTRTGDVVFFSVDPHRHLVAYQRDEVGFTVQNLLTGRFAQVPHGRIPHLSGDHTLI